jgi:MoaA/NifB/PqqE/SkfB family radical SAM enzyme
MNSPIRKTTIITGYNCNNRCRFCIYADRRNIAGKTTDNIIKEMFLARKRGSRWLVLVGGEVFIRDDIVYLISKAKQIGFKEIVAATNGRMFVYRRFVREILDAGITQIYFSLHGHTATLHDSLTRSPGSFKQQLAGIKNLYFLGFKNIGTHTTIVKPNYKYLPQIVKLICNLGINSMDFVFVDPNYGGAYEAFSELVPKISDIMPFIKKCLDFIKYSMVEHCAVRYVPICKLKGYEGYVSDIRDRDTVHTEHIAPDFKDYYVEKTRRDSCRIKTKKCFRCQYYRICEGVWKEYIRRFGDEELSPVL